MGLHTLCQKQITCTSLNTNMRYFYPIIRRENTSCFFLMKNRWNVFYLLLYKHLLHFFTQWHWWLSQWILSRQFHTQYKEPSLLQSLSSGTASLFALHSSISFWFWIHQCDLRETSVYLAYLSRVWDQFFIYLFFLSLIPPLWKVLERLLVLRLFSHMVFWACHHFIKFYHFYRHWRGAVEFFFLSWKIWVN